MNSQSFKDLLPLVSKPSRYLGTEVNSIHKDLDEIDVKVALAFPDVYEVGMSHQGLQILYHILNSYPYIAAERVYAPWTDMEELLRKDGRVRSTLLTGDGNHWRDRRLPAGYCRLPVHHRGAQVGIEICREDEEDCPC